MALTQLTKVDGGGISTTSDYRVGIITAIKFVGPFDGTGGNFTGVVTASSANFSGDVSIGGTLTYEDVTNIDSVGIITAKKDIHVGAGVSAVGVGTFGSLDISGDIDVDGHTNLDNVSIAGVSTFAGDIVVPDSIVHSGDTHTKIRFPTNDQISFENGGSESMRIYGYGQVLIGDGVDRRSGNAELTISGSSNVVLADNNPLYNQANPCFLHLSNANNSVDASETGILFHNTFSGSGNVALYSKKTGTYASDLIFRFRTGGTASTERVRITSSGQVKVGTGVTIETNGQATFVGVTTFSSDLYVAENIIHTGDTDTKIRFADAGDIIQLQAGGTTRIQTNNIGARIDTTLLLYGDAGNPGRLRLQEGGALSEIMVARNSDTNSFLYFKTEISGTTATRVMIDESGHFRPNVDSTNDLGITGTRWRNVYADTYYGDGSNLTGISADKIFENNSKVEVVDTGTGYITAEVDGTERLRVNDSGIDVSGEIELDNGGSAGLNFKRNGTLKADIEIGSTSDELAIRARGSSGFILLSTGSSATPRLRIDSVGNLVTGNQTSPTSSDTGNIYIKNGSTIGSVSHQLNYATNAVFDSSWKYITSGVGATRIVVNQNGYKFDTATSGTAGNAITFSERFNINADGKVVKQQFTATNTYAANDTTQCGYQSQNLSDTTNTYSALRLTAGNSSPATAQLSSIRTGAGANDFTIQLETGNTAFEALRIKSTGQVLIGTDVVASTNLVVYSDGTSDNKPATLYQNSLTGTGAGNGFYVGSNHNDKVGYVWNYENDKVEFGTNNQERVSITSTGQVNIGGDFDQTTYTMKVTGSFAATTKSFVIDHPTKEKHKLRYACLEGPENSVYVRGKTSDSVIELPDYWTGLVHEDSITVNVTPIGNHKVWVESINNNSVTIGSDGSEYFYTVFAERKDVDKLEVEVEE